MRQAGGCDQGQARRIAEVMPGAEATPVIRDSLSYYDS